MKKAFSLLLVVLLLVTSVCLSSCDTGEETLNGKTPYELYQAAAEYVEQNIGYSVQSTKNTGTGTITMADGSELTFQYSSGNTVVRNNRQEGVLGCFCIDTCRAFYVK